MTPTGDIQPASEHQTRLLIHLSSDLQRQAWSKAVGTALGRSLSFHIPRIQGSHPGVELFNIDGSGVLATADINVAGGEIVGAFIVNGGQGFKVGDTVLFHTGNPVLVPGEDTVKRLVIRYACRRDGRSQELSAGLV